MGAWAGGSALVGVGTAVHAFCFRGQFLHGGWGVSGGLLNLGVRLGPGHVLHSGGGVGSG